MADFTKTITNSLNLLGMSRSSKWGDANGFAYTMVWGTTKWGESTFSLVFQIEKLIQESITPDTSNYFEVQKLVSNDVTLTEDLTSETLSDGPWNVVFVPNTTEGESRVTTSWSNSSAQSVSYTCQAGGNTNWS